MTRFCLSSNQSVGCTFLDWSIHFLSGQHQTYDIDKRRWLELTASPLTDINAHQHFKNHPAGYEQFKSYIDHLDTITNIGNEIYSIYTAPLNFFNAVNKLGLSVTDISSNSNKICSLINDDTNKIYELCFQQDIKLIVVDSDPSVSLYFLKDRQTSSTQFNNQRSGNNSNTKFDMQEVFFSESQQTWNALGLSNIWDIREQHALNIRLSTKDAFSTRNLQHPHEWIHCLNLWTRGEDVMIEILDYLELTINNTRLTSWQPIYKQWQKIQMDHLEFNYNCQHIVDAIINNWYYKINLTFEQEVIIQHILLYQHNLNFKTWQLSKFPDNTQELHKLLEPNLHVLTPY